MPSAGDDVAVSFADLRRADGVSGRRLMVSVLGIVYDVGDEKGRQFFAQPDGSYRVMAGHDATYMLANMSLKADDADKFGVPYDADDRQTLAEWIAYFDACYPRVGWLIHVPAQHSITLRELPPTQRKRMGNTSYGGDGTEMQQRERHAAAQRRYDAVLQRASGTLRAETADEPPPPPPPPPHHQQQQQPPPAPKARSFSAELFHANRHAHARVLRCELMAQLVDGTVCARTYANFVAQLYRVYTELEPTIAACCASAAQSTSAGVSALTVLHDPRLARLPSLADDLERFYGSGWKSRLPSPLLATVRYVSRVHELGVAVAAWRARNGRDSTSGNESRVGGAVGAGIGAMSGDEAEHRLVVHHWMRYGAGLAGGQLLRASIARGLRLSPRADGTTPGVRYHNFELLERGPQSLGGLAAFYEAYLVALDGVGARASTALREAMMHEATLAFELNVDLNDAVSASAGASL